MNGLFTPSAKVQDRQPTVLIFLRETMHAVVGSAITPDEVDVGTYIAMDTSRPYIILLHYVYAHSPRGTNVYESLYVHPFYSIARGCKHAGPVR